MAQLCGADGTMQSLTPRMPPFPSPGLLSSMPYHRPVRQVVLAQKLLGEAGE